MGMYTEIYVNVDFKESTPDSVIDTLRCITGDIEYESERYTELMRDKPSRFYCLFSNMSYYTPRTCCGNLTYDKFSKCYSLIGKGDLKNYDNEIEAFFKFIAPYVDGCCEFIGYYRYEEDKKPTLVFLEDLL